MDAFNIISLIALLLGFFNIYYIYSVSKKVNAMAYKFKNKLYDMDIDSKLSSMLSSGEAIHGLNDIASELFMNLKQRFGFEAKSYFKLIDELKLNNKIDTELKEDLIDFFESMIHISYRKESLSPEEEETMKKKIKVILTRLKDY